MNSMVQNISLGARQIRRQNFPEALIAAHWFLELVDICRKRVSIHFSSCNHLSSFVEESFDQCIRGCPELCERGGGGEELENFLSIYFFKLV